MFKYLKKIFKINMLAYLSVIIIALLFTVIGVLFNKNNLQSLTSHPSNYKELYKLISSINNRNYNNKDVYNFDQENGNVTTSLEEKKYSDTNLQVLGVQEADIIKTDGNYIYALSAKKLYIIEVNNGELKLVSSINHYVNTDESNSSFTEIYVSGNKLIAIKNNSNYYKTQSDKMINWLWNGHSDVGVVVFDITDKSNPVKTGEVSQSGYYLSSRMIDNYLYLVSNYYVYINEYKDTDINNYIPYVKEDETTYLNVKDIYITPNPKSSQYIMVTGLDINNPNEFVTTKSVFGSGTNIYTSLNNLYIAAYDTVQEDGYYKNKTNLLKFSLNNGSVELKATGTVFGNILNQFSMDEYSDTFRIVTTSYNYKINQYDKEDSITIGDWEDETKNNLYVLDSNLNVIGKLEDLAKDERVYSVRFDESIVYFVTYEQVDPLFAVDLTNPVNPNIISELKILGFSEYLHVYNDKYLFGLGKDANADGSVTGMKISMYDITDKSNITEKYKLSLGNQYSWSEASYNHKAILVSTFKNIIAFPVDNSYLIFKFDETDGFSKISEINFEDNYWFSNLRGLYIDDSFYVYNGYELRSYNMSNFDNINQIKLETAPENISYEEIEE